MSDYRIGPQPLASFLFFDLSAWRGHSASAKSHLIKSLAVLPLRNVSGDPAQEYFADSMTEELITDLSKISALRVTSDVSSVRYKNSQKPLQQISQELNVNAIVKGSILRVGNRVRIFAQLIYPTSDSNRWAQSYEGDLQDVLTLQSSVANAIASAVQIKMTSEEMASLKYARSVNRKALEASLEGRYHLQKWNEQQFRARKEVSNDEELSKAII